jgi:ABC-type multidrug transport system ATPase subunit
LVSSHLLSEIELIANRIIIIDRGKKIVEGYAAELLDPAKTIVQIETADNVIALEKLKNQFGKIKLLQPAMSYDFK